MKELNYSLESAKCATCPKFFNAIQKYGWENFEHIILYEHLIKLEAENIEKELIIQYDATNNKKGYNILSGGDVSKGGWHHTEETKQKIAEASRTGGFKGHHHTEETKKILSEKKKGNTSARKKVQCIETGEIFDSMLLAAQSRGLKGANSITQAIKTGGRAGGYHWKII